MKKMHLILQAKGGVGKSLLTYLFALTKAHKPDTLFVDVDSSTKTSTRQLVFLRENQLESISLLNNHEMLVRDIFIKYLESVSQTNFKEIFFDFGAPESEQFPALMKHDIPFKLFLEKIGYKAHFHIVVAGGGSYFASMDYLQKIGLVINNEFPITVWKNITSFNNSENLASELEETCKSTGLKLAQFGDFEPHSSLGSEILGNISKGIPIEKYWIGAGMKINYELKLNFNYEQSI